MSETTSLSKWDGVIWEGVFPNFDATGAEQDVFDGSVWIDKQTRVAKADIEEFRAEATITPLGITSDYALPFIAAAIAKPEKILKVIDFGGGMGSSFLPLKSMLPDGQPLQFVVIEGKSICEHGRAIFEEYSEISFSDNIPQVEDVDIIHAGSSMHYVDNWIDLVSKFTVLSPKYLIFADLPAGEIDTFVTTQNYYGRKIPVRFWNIEHFVNVVEGLGYRLIMKSRFKNKYVPYLRDFDDSHRLDYFSQLVFAAR